MLWTAVGQGLDSSRTGTVEQWGGSVPFWRIEGTHFTNTPGIPDRRGTEGVLGVSATVVIGIGGGGEGGCFT